MRFDIRHLRRRQVIAIIVILVAAYPAYRALTVTIPIVADPISFLMIEAPISANGMAYAPFSAVVNVLFTTAGSFSAGNPITVRVTFSDVNLTDFLAKYNRIGFTNSFDPNNPFQTTTGPVVWGAIFLASDGNGNYVGSGTLDWLEGPSFMEALPNVKANITTGVEPSTPSPPVLSVGPSSDSIAQDSQATNERLSWVLVALSALMLQPVLEALFDRDVSHRDSPRISLEEQTEP